MIDEEEYWFGTEKGSYSFVLEPRSIQKQVCEYIFLVSQKEKDKFLFNRIVARYYDEKNKAVYYEVRSIEGDWEQKKYDIDEDWHLLK